MEPWSSQGGEGLKVDRTLVDTRGPILAVQVLNVSNRTHMIRDGAIVAKCSGIMEVTRGRQIHMLASTAEQRGKFGGN